MLANLFFHRRYILRAAIYDVRYRYAGMSLGVFWYFVNPAATIAVYTAVFSGLLVVNPAFSSGAPFALFLCLGIVPWLAFTETLIHASEAIVQNRLYLRRLPLPAEIFVAKSTLSATTGIAVSVILILLLSVLSGYQPAPSWLIVPLVAVMFQVLAFGLALSIATLRVLVRDIGELLRAVMHLWTWTLPIVYPEQLLPEGARAWLIFNPPYAFIHSFRVAVLDGSLPDLRFILAMFAWPAAALILGSVILSHARSRIKDAL